MKPLSHLWILIATACVTLSQDVQRDLRSISTNPRTLQRLVGGHIKHESNDVEGLRTASAGAGKDKGGDNDEEAKTLSQQVADGKYGLIQKEIFAKPVKTPGIISYEDNPEVPNDNEKTLGGLHKDEIWLAENHLLVLKGGVFPDHNSKQQEQGTVWPPIDDYVAPRRQVKIPSHPKVPPPFPVQLTENGPIQLLGTNTSRTLNGTTLQLALPPPDGYEPGTGPYFPPLPPYPYPPNATAGQTPFPVPPFPFPDRPENSSRGNGPGPFPYPPPPLNGSLQLPPYFASLPPGAAFLPPPDNLTNQYDYEDDPSIYYPPPYSFFYPKNNSTEVPPGPLVPGIILPPPPDFFAPLNKTKPTIRPPKMSVRVSVSTSTDPPRQIRPTTTPIPPTEGGKLHFIYAEPHTEVPNNKINDYDTTTLLPKVITLKSQTLHVQKGRVPVNRTVAVSLRPSQPYRPTTERHKYKPTVLKPIPPTAQAPVYYPDYQNTAQPQRPYVPYGPPKTRTMISTTQIPLKAFFTTSGEIDTNYVTAAPYNQRPAKAKTKPPASYYFYEEEPGSNSVTSPRTDQYLETKGFYKPYNYNQNRGTELPQYLYVTARPKYYTSTPAPQSDNFLQHIVRLQKQIQTYLTTQKPRPQYNINQFRAQTYRPQQYNVANRQPNPVYQYSFQAPDYPNAFRASKLDEEKFRPLPKYSVQIQPAILLTETPLTGIEAATEKPQVAKPQPVFRQPETVYQVTQSPITAQKLQVSSERPVPSKYYTTSSKPDYEYEDENIADKVQYTTPKSNYVQTTPNPVNHAYFTKQEENLFDENTKKYFTLFGQKLQNGATTPMPTDGAPTPQPPAKHPNIQIQYNSYRQKPASLAGDILVNYRQPRPSNNPQAEIITIIRPQKTQKYQPVEYIQAFKYVQPGASLQGDIEVNYRQPRPQQNPLSESINVQGNPNSGQQGSFISYQLPGDGAHFYFLTPQISQRSQNYYSPDGQQRRRAR